MNIQADREINIPAQSYLDIFRVFSSLAFSPGVDLWHKLP